MLHFTSIHFSSTLAEDILSILSYTFSISKKVLARLDAFSSFSSFTIRVKNSHSTSFQSMMRVSGERGEKNDFPSVSDHIDSSTKFQFFFFDIFSSLHFVFALPSFQLQRRQLAYFMSIIIGLFNEFIFAIVVCLNSQ